MASPIMVADDDPQFLRILEHHLQRWGWRVICLETKSRLLEQLALRATGLLLLDVRFGEHDGLEVLREVLSERPGLKVAMLTAFGSIDNAISAIRLGAVDYLTKPVDLGRLRSVLDHHAQPAAACDPRRGPADRGPHQATSRAILGESRVMDDLRALIRRVAATDTTALVLGESGTGKELVARALHELSPRRPRPFVPLNVAALPRELVESTLFGHAKGAFTGADRRQYGCCEAADGGTLFLDEIGEMEIGPQAKLLRFLQERSFQRVGESQLISVDVRIVAATNRDLVHQVRLGSLREDLYYRLNVVPIHVPPLRHRREDIPLLVEHFAVGFASRSGQCQARFTDAALDALMAHPWPGNVRELENLVERLLILGPRATIDASDVLGALGPSPGPLGGRVPVGHPRTEGPADAGIPPARESLRPMEEIERRAIKEALASTNGSVRDAARLLGLGQATVYRKLKKYQIQ